LAGSNRERGWSTSDRRSTHRRDPAGRRSHVDRRVAQIPTVQDERRKGTDRRAKDRRSGRDRRDDAMWQPVSIDDAASANQETDLTLVTAAAEARTRAQAHYSHFMVGAALETSDGIVIGGCNIENATYGLTLCAERVALVKALSDGHSIFTRIAVVADTEAPTPPCGPCRQLLWEYCGDIDIILGNLNGPTGRFRLSALLPMPFDRRLLG
jgi:cytidine deaminase